MRQITISVEKLRERLAARIAPHVLDTVQVLCLDVAASGGRALLVGGCVRDAAADRPVRDLDIEVFDVAPGRLCDLVRARVPADVVGRRFPVLHLRGLPVDVSLPRVRAATAEPAAAPDFAAGADPAASPADAARRRDFTLDAIGFDPVRGEIVDPCGGLADLAAGVLRHSSERFDEDPLRVLRAMQLLARFELTVAPETLTRCRNLTPDGLARERVFGEWKRLVLEGARPSRGLHFLRDAGWLRHFPELEALVGCPQDPVWHPEGDVWVHTLHCMDAFARARSGDPHDDLVVGLAVLCHDFAKPDTTQERAGRITSHGHEALGAEKTLAWLARWTDERDLAAQVAALVGAHLAPALLHRQQASDAAVRRLARRVGRIDLLVRVAAADHAGRPPLTDPFVAGEWLLERAEALEVTTGPPRPLVLGRHLIAEGLTPGPGFAPILRDCYEAQLAGEFTTEDDALAWARRRIASRANPE
jgi:tRNA nucleotidyltransferase (CCA-adding enzyme)